MEPQLLQFPAAMKEENMISLSSESDDNSGSESCYGKEENSSASSSSNSEDDEESGGDESQLQNQNRLQQIIKTIKLKEKGQSN